GRRGRTARRRSTARASCCFPYRRRSRSTPVPPSRSQLLSALPATDLCGRSLPLPGYRSSLFGPYGSGTPIPIAEWRHLSYRHVTEAQANSKRGTAKCVPAAIPPAAEFRFDRAMAARASASDKVRRFTWLSKVLDALVVLAIVLVPTLDVTQNWQAHDEASRGSGITWWYFPPFVFVVCAAIVWII